LARIRLSYFQFFRSVSDTLSRSGNFVAGKPEGNGNFVAGKPEGNGNFVAGKPKDAAAPAK